MNFLEKGFQRLLCPRVSSGPKKRELKPTKVTVKTVFTGLEGLFDAAKSTLPLEVEFS